MININIEFDFYRIHRMPQYNSLGNYLRVKEEKDIWLRIPIKISNEQYSLSFFIQSKISIKEIQDFDNSTNIAFMLTKQSFLEELSKQKNWNILTMEDFYPLNNLKIKNFKENSSMQHQINITKKLHDYFLETYEKIEEARNLLIFCKNYLNNIIENATSYGFSHYQDKINMCIYFIEKCEKNISPHKDKIYFKEQLFEIKSGFQELIKRKRENNDKYRFYLHTTGDAIFRLPVPKEWEGKIPSASNELLNLIESSED